jgi:hypothetical protein
MLGISGEISSVVDTSRGMSIAATRQEIVAPESITRSARSRRRDDPVRVNEIGLDLARLGVDVRGAVCETRGAD